VCSSDLRKTNKDVWENEGRPIDVKERKMGRTFVGNTFGKAI
jgi:hypothetical protein